MAGLVGRVAARPEADGELTAVACNNQIPPVVVAGRAGGRAIESFCVAVGVRTTVFSFCGNQ